MPLESITPFDRLQMAIYTVTKADKKLAGSVSLPASKSISNRLLIIRSLCNSNIRINNLSTAEDTVLLLELLERIDAAQTRTADHKAPAVSLDCRNAGTVIRFLTSFLAITPGTWLLTGSERMLNRPIGILVEALRNLGASIDYAGEEGYPPLRITGIPLKGGEVTVDVSVSSQFVSSLLLIAPVLPEGLTIRMIGQQVSFSYVEMTRRIMEEFGVVVEQKGDLMIVKSGRYRPESIAGNSYSVEADWSSAAFWYEAAALAGSAEIRLPGLRKDTIQGDAVLAELFRPFGVETTFEKEGVVVKKAQGTEHSAQGWRDEGTLNLSSFPDLAPPLIVTCAALGIPARFTGLHHLKIKESDRLQALETELERLHIPIRHHCHCEAPEYPEDAATASLSLRGSRVLGRRGNGIIEMDEQTPLGERTTVTPPVIIQTYDDHRIAMAFAMLALGTGAIRIDNPSVVSKSYPGFWEELKRVGFQVRET